MPLALGAGAKIRSRPIFARARCDDCGHDSLGDSGPSGAEYRGRAESYDYQLYLAPNDIVHTKTKVKLPQTNGSCEPCRKAPRDEFTKAAFGKKDGADLQRLQQDLDEWLLYCISGWAH